MDVNATVFLPHSALAVKTITLENDVSALEVVRLGNAVRGSGGFSVIPKGSRLEVCGTGFNARTYEVRCQDRLFFVFHQDVDPVREPRKQFKTVAQQLRNVPLDAACAP